MACNDRQLSQEQREAGYTQQRTGVPFAVRPFSGSATIENLIDYLNRELVPGVRATRNAVNDVFLQVADQAPSANPLSYYFSTSVAASDPTVGRIKVNASPQNTSSVIRISQSNARLQDVTPWLDVMSGGPTTPLGTVTLLDSINPARFLRFDLNTMTDQGAYWDLGVTFIEGSHSDPFVEDEAVVLAFIAGVSAAGSTVPVGSISPIARDTFLGNIGTTTAAPAAVPLADVDSTSIVYDPTSHTFQRAALTGFATASQNSNATSSAEPIVTFSASSNMSNERVATSSTSITVDTATTGQIEFRSAAKTGAIAQAANANTTVFAGIRDNGSAENDRTNLNFLSTNDITLTVTDDSGNDELEITATLAAGSTQNEGTGGVVTLNAGTKVLAITTNITITGFARSGGNVDGDRFWLRCNDGIECTLTSSAGGTGVNAMSLPYNETLIVPGRGMMEFRYETSWRGISTGDKGRLLRTTTYTSGSGTHTYLSDCGAARVRMKGGGAGGAGAGAPDGNVGGGGGEGAYEELLITTVPTSSSYAVGAAGAAGSSSSGTGGSGGDTTFNDGSVTRTAGGGSGGIAGGSIGEGGAGGTPDSIGGTVVYACRGAPGQFGFLSSIPEGFGGNGGGSGAGKGGTNGGSSEAGASAASNSGAGGGGGSRPNSPNVAGAAGGSGYIIVEEYT